MSIDRYELVKRHFPQLTAPDPASVLTVGNGQLAYSFDITGMQTLEEEYEVGGCPLCTLSQWGWHTTPVDPSGKVYTQEDLVKTKYTFNGRPVAYPIKPAPGNEEVYTWLRKNPHRMHLASLGLTLDKRTVKAEDLSQIHQTLDLWGGIARSHFCLENEEVTVLTCVHPNEDTVSFQIISALAANGRLGAKLHFSYPDSGISARDESSANPHRTNLTRKDETFIFHRTIDKTVYDAALTGENFTVSDPVDHTSHLCFTQPSVTISLGFAPEAKHKPAAFVEAQTAAAVWWQHFWTTTGVIDFSGSLDPRASELERRIVLSQYLLTIQSAGNLPPQETGLTVNSWYGKFHLEMTPVHEAWLPLFGRSDLLLRVIPWYEEHLPEARANAAVNGYTGARWPKMVGPDAIDSPSPIAPLLCWQQPHILFLLDLLYESTKDIDILERFLPLITETADFCADFAVKNQDGFYELLSPLIPVQECHPEEETKNPVFEVEYWVYALKTAAKLTALCKQPVPSRWLEVGEHMIVCPVSPEGVYEARSGCTETYTRFAKDHPSFLMAYGLLDTGRMQPEAIRKSLLKVLETYDKESLWGWDFAVMAMTASRLGDPDMAVDLLLYDTPKNAYTGSGNNRQSTRKDLPLYLPGNGSLLYAAGMMAAGWEGCKEPLPGFPKDGTWEVRFEGIHAVPSHREEQAHG